VYQYEGINPNFTGTNVPKNVYEEFKNAIPLDTLYNKYTTWRPMKSISYQYSFNDDRGGEDCSCSGPDSSYKSAVGAQLFIMTVLEHQLWLLLVMSDNAF
jgi:hypothetical protein